VTEPVVAGPAHEQRCATARPSAEEAPGAVLDAIQERAHRDLGCKDLQLAAHGKAAAVPAGASGVGYEGVGEGAEGETCLEHLDRGVPAVAVDVVARALA